MKAYKPTLLWENGTVTFTHLSFLDRIFLIASLAGILALAFPHVSLAQTLKASPPLVFEVNKYADLPLISHEFQEDVFGAVLAKSIVVEPKDPRVELLKEYLLSKRSPMSPHAENLLQHYHYRLIIGISFAESNFCKHQIRPHNCWGIGGGWPESYPTYEAAFTRANQLIQRYHDNGMTTPKLMRSTWVGWKNDNWIIAVEQAIDELEERGL